MFQQIIDRAGKTSPIEDLVAAVAAIDILEAAYKSTSTDVPEGLAHTRKRIVRQIEMNRMDEIELRRKEIQSRMAALKTPAEKRAELEAELAKLN